MISLNIGDIVYYFEENVVDGRIVPSTKTGRVVRVNGVNGKVAVVENNSQPPKYVAFDGHDLNRYFFLRIKDMYYRMS